MPGHNENELKLQNQKKKRRKNVKPCANVKNIIVNLIINVRI